MNCNYTDGKGNSSRHAESMSSLVCDDGCCLPMREGIMLVEPLRIIHAHYGSSHLLTHLKSDVPPAFLEAFDSRLRDMMSSSFVTCT